MPSPGSYKSSIPRCHPPSTFIIFIVLHIPSYINSAEYLFPLRRDSSDIAMEVGIVSLVSMPVDSDRYSVYSRPNSISCTSRSRNSDTVEKADLADMAMTFLFFISLSQP